MKLPQKCEDYNNAVKNFLISTYVPFNALNFYINNNLYDNLWEDFKYDSSLMDVLLATKNLIQSKQIILPARFDLKENWVYNASEIMASHVKNRSSYLRTRDLYLKDYPVCEIKEK